MSLYSNTACIVYPVDWQSHNWLPPEVKDPHCTIHFLGDIDLNLNGMSLEQTLDIFKDVPDSGFQYVHATEWAAFGPNKDYPVMRLKYTEHMELIKNSVTEAVNNADIDTHQDYPYNPHVTVDLATIVRGRLPDFVLLNHAQLWYRGEKHYIGKYAERLRKKKNDR